MSYRHPKTLQEAKANQDDYIEEYDGYKVKIRSKRKAHNLPNLYDDIPVHRDECWKSKRKMKYHDRKRD